MLRDNQLKISRRWTKVQDKKESKCIFSLLCLKLKGLEVWNREILTQKQKRKKKEPPV